MAVSPPLKASSSQKSSTNSIPPPSPGTKSAEVAFLATVEGEISFFRSIMRARPVGLHKYFHILAIQRAVQKDTGRLLHVESIWEKLQSCYDLDALEAIVSIFNRTYDVQLHFFEPLQDMEAEGHQLLPNATSPVAIRSPSPSENLARHPFFREEYTLPFDEAFEILISQRRMRATASAPSSPVPSPTPVSVPTKSQRKGAAASGSGGGRRRGKSKADMAGLVGGDSDSSALTQESGDEAAAAAAAAVAAAETPRESVVTGTDGGTEFEDEDTEMKEPSPGQY